MYTLLERFLIGATPTWRVLLAAFASTPFFLGIGGLYLAALCDSAVRNTLHPQAILVCVVMFALAAALNLLLVWRLWPQRHRPDPVPGATLLIIELIGLTFAMMSISIGVLTTGTAMVLMGVLAVGIWLFEQRAMLIGYLSVNVLIIFHDVGVLLHWWPYAPALTSLTYGTGASHWWFNLVRELLFVCGWTALISILWLLIGSLESITEQLARLSNTDGLTGLANRRAFMDVLNTEIERQSRTGQALCIVLIDADHFKRVNDERGHMEGDKVLVTVAQLLAACVRHPTDLACRLGGEEFALILPDTAREQAAAVCARLREALAECEFGAQGQHFKITLSMGLVETTGQSPETAFKQADEQLYKAKSSGRDRVCMLGQSGVAA